MMQLFLEGGFPMWFILLFGGGSLGVAAKFAWKPKRETLPLLITITLATIFTAIMGVATDLAAVGHHVVEHWDKFSPEIVQVLLQGFAESMAPAIMGFGLVSLVALITVLGFYRESRGA